MKKWLCIFLVIPTYAAQRDEISEQQVIEYVQKTRYYDVDDEELIPTVLPLIIDSENGDYHHLCHGILSEDVSPTANEILLFELKNQHQQRMVHMRQSFIREQQKRRQERRKFYISMTITGIATLASIVEAILLIIHSKE